MDDAPPRVAPAPGRVADATPRPPHAMSSDATTPKPDETLSFDRADNPFARDTSADAAAPVACDQCREPIALAYFEANGRVLCAKCKHVVEHAWNGGDSTRTGRLMRATLFGLAGGIVGGAVWFAIAAYFNVELGLIAIAVGFLVGQGVRRGASGRSGRRYQVLAALLTYAAISGSYTAMFAKGIAEEAGKGQATADSTTIAARPAPAVTTTGDSLSDSTVAGIVATIDAAGRTDSTAPRSAPADSAAQQVAAPIAVALGIIFALTLPILANVMDMPGGLIGLAIIFFALQQAWALNAAAPLVITGPHRLGAPRPPAA